MSDESMLQEAGLDPNAPAFSESAETPDSSQANPQVESAADAESSQSSAAETSGDADAAAESGFRAEFKQKFGIDLGQKYKTDDEAKYGLANAFQLVGRRDQDAEVGKLIRENPGAVIEQLKQIYPAAFGVPSQQQQQAKPTESEVPEWDDSWETQVETNEQGILVAKPGADPSIPGKVTKYAKWYQKRQRDIATNFEKVVEQRARQIATEIAQQTSQQTVQAELARHADAAVAQSVFQEEKAWMFNNGDARPGNLSPRGQQAAQIINALGPFFSNSRELMGLTKSIMGMGAVPETKPANPQAKKQTNVAGSHPGTKAGLRKGESIDEMIKRLAQEEKIDLSQPVFS